VIDFPIIKPVLLLRDESRLDCVKGKLVARASPHQSKAGVDLIGTSDYDRTGLTRYLYLLRAS